MMFKNLLEKFKAIFSYIMPQL